MSHFVQHSANSAEELLKQFLVRYGIASSSDPRQTLQQLATAYSQLPYENLSKILRDRQTDQPDEVRRLPSEVLNDHYRLGTGGTCFSLTWTLLHLIRALGLEAEPILADRRYGPDTHCALVVWIDGVKHLLDPGYLLVNAIAFPKQGELIVPTSFHEVKLLPEQTGDRVRLQTIHQNQSTYRLTYKTDPVDTSQFLKAWDESFQFEMMRYPVLSKIVENKQFYLQKQSLLIRSRESTERIDVEPDKIAETIQNVFGIHPSVVDESLRVLR
ncbi:MAG: arylamine N-acetyltransferase [Gemmatales bacterium]